MAIVIFCQGMGGAIFLIIANAIFSNSLRHLLEQRAADTRVPADVIVDAGARAVRQLVSGDQLDIVLKAYSDSVDNVMYLGIGVAVCAFAFSWGLGWKDIRVQSQSTQPVEKSSEDETTAKEEQPGAAS